MIHQYQLKIHRTTADSIIYGPDGVSLIYLEVCNVLNAISLNASLHFSFNTLSCVFGCV